MKGIILKILVLSFVLILSACNGGEKVELVLPEASELSNVEIIADKVAVNYQGEDEIEDLISALVQNSKSTNKDSVNDEPTNVEEYITIKFYHKIPKDNPIKIYLYDTRGKAYIERPYSGIWRLNSETYNTILKNIEK